MKSKKKLKFETTLILLQMTIHFSEDRHTTDAHSEFAIILSVFVMWTHLPSTLLVLFCAIE